MTRVTVETTHTDADAARTVAASVRPDNTADVVTTVERDCVRTAVDRPTTGGAQSSTDDYVVNVAVADRVIAHVRDGTADASDEAADASARDSTAEVSDGTADASDEASTPSDVTTAADDERTTDAVSERDGQCGANERTHDT